MNITREKILTVDPSRLLLSEKNRLPKKFLSVLEPAVTRLIGHGWCSRDRLLEIIQQAVDLSIISSSPIASFATSFKIRSIKTYRQ
ncbi:hypothetical protein JOC78_001372 [Bacillus ectoiniformans]|uniref:hypothetical protein n=1 Tax=Bacillus ectoiniformans TaxID=1494429 RepID=UPI0019592398|nr:hypothetical protein [Bacillus ectoiniformans]MBM7648430.1 hypothetical protein [Bacillus ectoiniformans]